MAYGTRLSAENPQLRYVLTYPVREAFRAPPKYYLVFVSRSDQGIPVMNDSCASRMTTYMNEQHRLGDSAKSHSLETPGRKNESSASNYYWMRCMLGASVIRAATETRSLGISSSRTSGH